MQVREQLISETNARIEAQVRIDIGFIHPTSHTRFIFLFRSFVCLFVFFLFGSKSNLIHMPYFSFLPVCSSNVAHLQARTQQLLQQNRELLEHLASLGGYTENERAGLTSANISLAPQVFWCYKLYTYTYNGTNVVFAQSNADFYLLGIFATFSLPTDSKKHDFDCCDLLRTLNSLLCSHITAT